MSKLTGKLVWITGASSGIGEALAQELGRRGARLVLSARRRSRLEDVAQRCAPAQTHVLPLDVSDAQACTAAAREVEAGIGPVDVMVHNAGISQRGSVVDTSVEVDRRIMEVNYFAPVVLTKALLPGMLARRSGRFVVISSVTGYVATQQRSAYAASKHALHGFFEALRAEVHDQGVRVTLVCPGFVQTEVSLNALDPHGNPYGVMDNVLAKGLPPAACARRIADAIEHDRAEVLIAGWEGAAVFLRRFAPSLLRQAVRRVSTTS